MSLSIVRERPSRRRAYGINAPLFVSAAGGEKVRALEWSHLGVVLPEDVLPPLDGGHVHLALHLNFQGYDIAVPAKAKLDHTEDAPTPPGAVRLEFIDLPPRSAALIEHFVEDYVRGRLVPAEDTLVRIDAPAEPISTKPDPPPPGTVERRSIRPYVMSAFYLALGLATFAYVAMILYANTVRLEVHTAVVSRPVEVVQMPVDGMIAELDVERGDRVRAGAVIARVADPELLARREDARATLAEAERHVTLAERRLEVERSRLDDYRLVNETERREALVAVRAKREAYQAAVSRFEDVRALADKGFTPHRVVEEAGAAMALAKSRLEAAQLVEERRRRMEEVSVRRHHNGREFVVDLDMLALELETAEAQRDKMRDRLAALDGLRSRRDVSAGPGGRVVALEAVKGQQLPRLSPLAVVEEEVPAIVEAFLSQDEVLEIGLGDIATVFLPATKERFDARVTTVDRTSEFIDEQRAQYVWRGPKDRSARVTLAPVNPVVAERLGSGLPATVLFRRAKVSPVPDVVRESVSNAARKLGWSTAEPGAGE